MSTRRATGATSRPARLTSVGSKLAGSTIALILVVTAGVYLKVSQWQRENLLQAREVSASALTRLFIDSCVPALVFDDEQKIRDELTTLGRNDDVEYAAVWRSDPSGDTLQMFGELRRANAVEILTKVPGATQLRRERDRVVLSSPIRDQNGTLMGATAAVFSLSRENRAIAQIERTILIVSSAVAVGLTLLLMMMARLVLVGPLSKLVSAARALEQGGRNAVDIAVDIHSRDEVGQLAQAFRRMASAIKVREEDINARNGRLALTLGVLEEREGRIMEDLREAQAFQQSILPVTPPLPGVDLDVVYRPLDLVGGDLYDLHLLDPFRLRIFVADATGHGVHAAFETMVIKSEYEAVKQARGDADVLRELNDRIVGRFPGGKMMFTAVCMTLDLASGRLTCSSAGHPAPLLRSRHTWTEVEADGTFVGCLPGAEFPELTLPFEEGDSVYVFSDGAVEGRNRNDEMFGLTRLMRSLEGVGGTGASPGTSVWADLQAFLAPECRPTDDFTFVAARWTGG